MTVFSPRRSDARSDEDIDLGDWISDLHAKMATDGTVTGKDVTAQFQAMVDYAVSFIPAGTSRVAGPRIKGGNGRIRISGSVDFSALGGNNRHTDIDLAGLTIYMDGANKIPLDLTKAYHFTLRNGHFVGSKNSTPLCAVKTGRSVNNLGAGRWKIENCATDSAESPGVESHFRYGALWQMSSEECNEFGNRWSNSHAAGAGDPCYGAVYDCLNSINYDAYQYVSAISSANPGVFTIAGHGWTTGDKVVATVRSIISDVAPGLQTTVEGFAWTVTVLTANTFTLAKSGVNFDGTAFAAPANLALARERFPYSEHIGDVRPEPWKPHSQLQNTRIGNVYYAPYAKAAVLQGQVDNQAFDNNFLVGTVGFHLVHGKGGSTNPHWGTCRFNAHIEAGVAGVVVHHTLIDAATENAGGTSRFGGCSWYDNALRATDMLARVQAGQLVALTDSDLAIQNDTGGTVQLVDDGTKYTMAGGRIALEQQSYNNIPAAQTPDTVLVDFRAGTWARVSRRPTSPTAVNSATSNNYTVLDVAPIVKDASANAGLRNRKMLTTSARAGDMVRWVRTAASAGGLGIQDDTAATLATLAAVGDWAEMTFNGTHWVLTGANVAGTW